MVFDRDGVTVTALGIPHGNIPSLAYRVQTRDTSIVFSSDQTGTNPNFIEFAKGANVLIMHVAIPVADNRGVVGHIAQEAGVGRLVVSHFGPFPLDPAVHASAAVMD